jgi:hypothetical protein
MTTVVGTVYDGSTSATTHNITVPAGVTTGMTGLFVIGTGSSVAVTTTLSRSGSTFTSLDERNAVNTRVAVWTGTTLAAGNTVTLTLSSSAAVTVGHYYTDDYTFTAGTLSAAIRSSSTTTTTSGSVTPALNQQVLIVGVERTTTATTFSGAVTSASETVSDIFYGEGTGSAQASVYAGTFIASAAAPRTATLTYSNSSGNGYAALVLTSLTGSGGGGGPTAGTPGALHNISRDAGANHYNLGIGRPSGHVDITENQLEAGFTESPYYYMTADNTAVVMAAPLDGGTTSSNTQYPRVEYRELQPGGSGNSDTPKAAWNGASGLHYMRGRTRVMRMPPNKPQLVIAQTHDASDDTSMIRLSSATRVEFRLGDTVVTSAAHVMGRWYDWEIRVDNGDISWYWGDLTTPIATRVDGHTGSGYYFKFGCYAQSNESIDSVSSGPFIVEVAAFPETWHTGYAAPSIPTAVPTVNAGLDASVATGTTFGRTATESSSSTITNRVWSIVSGPTGAGTTIDTDASLAWTPTVAGTYVLRYSATNTSGTGSDDVTVTVTTAEPGGGGGGGTGTRVYLDQYPDGTPYFPVPAGTTVVNVSSASALTSALSAAVAGQRIVIANGTYNGQFTMSGRTGTSTAGISIEAATPGGVTFSSGSRFTITNCSYVTLRGVRFPFDTPGDTIGFRGTSNRCALYRCWIGPSSLGSPGTESGNYVYVGDNCHTIRIGYNDFGFKATSGNVVRVYGNFDTFAGCQRVRMDHNYIHDVGPEVGNDKEGARFGVSTMSRTRGYHVYERNVNARILAEPEVFSGKMADIRCSGNVFNQCAGGLVARHGTDYLVTDNYIVDRASTTASAGLESGGIRFYDDGHTIAHNYIDGIIGETFQASLLVDTGDAEGSSPALNAHWRVINALIERNVIVNSQTPIVVGDNYSLNPSNVTIRNNITAGTTQAGPIVYVGSTALMSSPAPSGNQHFASTGAAGLVADGGGIFRLAGYGPRMTYLTTADVGPLADLSETDGTGTPLGGSTGGGTGTTGPVVNAGADVSVTFGSNVVRTGTVVSGDAITAHRWSIEAGPTQVGTTLATTASLFWSPPQVGSYVLRYAATNSAGTGTDDITVAVGVGGGSSTPATPVGVSPTATGESANVDIAAPAGVQSGDFEFAVIVSAGAETITATPAGWSLVRTASVTSGAGDAGGPCTAWLYSATNPGNTNPAAWTKSGTRVWHGVRTAFRGQSALGETGVIAETVAATTHPVPAVVPARANARVVAFIAADYLNGAVGPFTPPATWTERYDQTVTSGTENESIAIADNTAAPSGGSSTGVTLGGTSFFTESFTSGGFAAFEAIQSVLGHDSTPSSWDQTPHYLRVVNAGTGRETVARFEIRNGDIPPGDDEERVELVFPSSCDVVEGNERWYQFDVRLGDPTWSAPTSWEVIWQWHHNGSTGSPPLEVGPYPDGTVKLSQDGLSSPPAPVTLWTIRPGVWETVVLHVRFSNSATTGFVHAFVNGVEVLPQTARRTMVDTGNYLKAGIYRDGTHTNTQVLMYDNIQVSSSATVGSSGAGVSGAFTSSRADQCAVFAAVLEAPAAESVVVLPSIEPVSALGALTVGFAGPEQTITLPSLSIPMKYGRFTVTTAPAPQTILLRGIAPR